MPIREAYLTTGRGRKLKLGSYEVTIVHAPRWMPALGAAQAGAAVRALAWMGRRVSTSRWPPCGEGSRPGNGKHWQQTAPASHYGWLKRSAKKRFVVIK